MRLNWLWAMPTNLANRLLIYEGLSCGIFPLGQATAFISFLLRVCMKPTPGAKSTAFRTTATWKRRTGDGAGLVEALAADACLVVGR